MQHPKLEQPLIDKLVMLADPRHHFEIGLRSAATLMLNVSGLNSPNQGQGHKNLHRPVDPSTRVEPAHSSGKIEGVKREPDIGEC